MSHVDELIRAIADDVPTGDEVQTSAAGTARERLLAAIATETPPAPLSRTWRRFGRRRPRPGRLALVLAMLLVGGAAAARTVFDSTGTTQSAAISGMACVNGRQIAADVFGRSPIASCRGFFPPGTRLTVCLDVRHGPLVIVLRAQGNDPCRRDGYRRFPSSYSSDVVRADTLQRSMLSVWLTRNCWTPSTLITRVDRLLVQQDWPGWHAEIRDRFSVPGPCGAVEYTGTGSIGDFVNASMNPQTKTVAISTAPSLTAGRIGYRLWKGLTTETACRSLTDAIKLVQTATTADGVPNVRTISNAPGAGGSLNPIGRELYERGCAVVAGVGIGPDGHTVHVWINQNAFPPPQRHLDVRASRMRYPGPPFGPPPSRY